MPYKIPDGHELAKNSNWFISRLAFWLLNLNLYNNSSCIEKLPYFIYSYADPQSVISKSKSAEKSEVYGSDDRFKHSDRLFSGLLGAYYYDVSLLLSMVLIVLETFNKNYM